MKEINEQPPSAGRGRGQSYAPIYERIEGMRPGETAAFEFNTIREANNCCIAVITHYKRNEDHSEIRVATRRNHNKVWFTRIDGEDEREEAHIPQPKKILKKKA